VTFDKVGDVDVVTEEFDRIIRHVTYVKYKGGSPAEPCFGGLLYILCDRNCSQNDGIL